MEQWCRDDWPFIFVSVFVCVSEQWCREDSPYNAPLPPHRYLDARCTGDKTCQEESAPKHVPQESSKSSISSISSKWTKNQEYFFLCFSRHSPIDVMVIVYKGQYSSLKSAKTNLSKRTELKIVFWLFLIVLTLFSLSWHFFHCLTLFSLSWLLPPCPPPLPCRVMGRGLFPILRTGAGPQNPAYLAHHCERPCFYICCFTMFYYFTGPLNKSRLSGPSLYHETLFLHLLFHCFCVLLFHILIYHKLPLKAWSYLPNGSWSKNPTYITHYHIGPCKGHKHNPAHHMKPCKILNHGQNSSFGEWLKIIGQGQRRAWFDNFEFVG